MDNCNTRITIITVCFNAEDSIAATMDSVLNQTYNEIEYIIKDGDSSDQTKSIVERKIQEQYSQKNVKFISEKDSGLYNAMNISADLASGEYVIF